MPAVPANTAFNAQAFQRKHRETKRTNWHSPARAGRPAPAPPAGRPAAAPPAGNSKQRAFVVMSVRPSKQVARTKGCSHPRQGCNCRPWTHLPQVNRQRHTQHEGHRLASQGLSVSCKKNQQKDVCLGARSAADGGTQESATEECQAVGRSLARRLQVAWEKQTPRRTCSGRRLCALQQARSLVLQLPPLK